VTLVLTNIKMQFITFYSYKGGVGRTQLVANLATYFAMHKNKKILLIDWDLEAPGLHYFFGMQGIQQMGLIDLLIDYCKLMESEQKITQDSLLQDLNTRFSNFISTASLEKGRVDLMPAGYYDEHFSQKVNTFKWQYFYENLDGANYIEIFKLFLQSLDYDYIFIDSRTGISDYGGICNIQFPDMNIMVVAPTSQGFEGTQRIIKSIQNSNYVKKGFRKPIIMPLLSRLDTFVDVKQRKVITDFQEIFQESILRLYDFRNENIAQWNENAKKSLVSDYIATTFLEYKSELSYGETLLFENNEPIISGTLSQKFANIGAIIEEIKDKFILTPNELLILKYLAVLPSVEIKESFLEKLFLRETVLLESAYYEALESLVKKQFLEKKQKEETYYLCLPAIQSMIKDRIAKNIDEVYILCISLIAQILYEDFNQNSISLIWLDFGESLLNNVQITETDEVASLHNNLGANYFYVQKLEKALNHIKKAVEIRLQIFEKGNPILDLTQKNMEKLLEVAERGNIIQLD